MFIHASLFQLYEWYYAYSEKNPDNFLLLFLTYEIMYSCLEVQTGKGLNEAPDVQVFTVLSPRHLC